jgi:hypothetical protein
LSYYDWTSTYGRFEVDGVLIPVAVTTTVAPTPAQVAFMASTTLTATARDAANQIIPDMAYAWTSSNPSAVAVTPAGPGTATAIAMGAGSPTITATPVQGASGAASVNVNTGALAVHDSFTAADLTALSTHVPEVNLPVGLWRISGSGATVNANHARANGADWNPITATIDSGISNGIVGVDWTPGESQSAAALVARASDPNNYLTAVYWSRMLQSQARLALVQVGSTVLRVDQNPAGQNTLFDRIVLAYAATTDVPENGDNCTMQCRGVEGGIACTITCQPGIIELPLPGPFPAPPGPPGEPPGTGPPPGGYTPCTVGELRVNNEGTPSCDPDPGQPGGQSALRTGIYAKPHRVGPLNYFHVAIRIVVTEAERNSHPRWKSVFVYDLGTGYWLATIGGAPTSLPCGGFLGSAINRPSGLWNTPALVPEKLTYDASQEHQLIDALFELDDAYGDDALYYCWPGLNDEYYNSNSYAAGLLIAAGVTLPVFPWLNDSLFPGWSKPLPTDRFLRP